MERSILYDFKFYGEKMSWDKLKKITFIRFNILKDYLTVSSSLLISRILGGLITILIARALGNIGFASFSAGFFIMTILGNCTAGIDKTFVFQFVSLKGRQKESILSLYTLLKLYIWLLIMVVTILILFFFRNSFNFDVRFAIFGAIFSVSFWILNYISSIYQALQKFKLYGKTQIIYYLAVFLMVMTLFLLKFNNSYLYLSVYFVGALVLAILLLPFKNLKIISSQKGLAELLQKAKWLIFSEIAWLIFVRLDYFTVSRFICPVDLGNYALALRMINVITIFVSSLSLYILPKAAEIDSLKKLRKFWKASLGIGISLIGFNIILFLLAKPIVLIFFGREYLPAVKFFRLMILAYLPTIFFPPFKYLILRFSKKIHYFIFNGILLTTYLIFLRMFELKFGSNGPIFIKGLSFLATLLFGVILYLTNKRRNLK